MTTLDAIPPPGYGPLSLLDRKRHAGRSVRAQAARFAAGLHGIYLTLPEFVAASRCCPIIFAQAGDDFQPTMVVGLAEQQNLCVDAEGDWRSDCYLPAYVRRYPFCTAQLAQDTSRVVVCVDEAGLDTAAPHFFDARGEDTPAWRDIDRLIQDMDIATRQTNLFSARVAGLGLLEPFDAAVRPVVGERRHVGGMWRVNESRLNTLPEAVLVELMRSGFLSRIYAHLMSLDNFQRLLGLDVERVQKAMA